MLTPASPPADGPASEGAVCSWPDAAGAVERALELAAAELWAARSPAGFWEGELSSSALSTATAVAALALARGSESDAGLIERGIHWLASHGNPDGGWGDTIRSGSNISTTLLVWAAFRAAGAEESSGHVLEKAERWLKGRTGSLSGPAIAQALLRRYGNDRTFSVPILTMCALCGRLGNGAEAWQQVMQLPFELAACPAGWFAALRLPVVSYALPALIAIGQARHWHFPTSNPLLRWVRDRLRSRTLALLESIQPASGGFLEAIPLTSFVAMSLASMDLRQHPVTERCLGFLRRLARPDGSWAIDTNLATWVTTLAIDAGEQVFDEIAPEAREFLLEWLLAQQGAVIHPYTRAAPGGWGWTDQPGSVPDADDTAGALLALHRLDPENPRVRRAAEAGIRWLLDLQNSDGGIPTFCRGWGALPFDRSSPDLTAHAVRAWIAWFPAQPRELQSRLLPALSLAKEFLIRNQRLDGSWVPLWFGNEDHPAEENPVYGTSRVLLALAVLARFNPRLNRLRAVCVRGAVFLLGRQSAAGFFSSGPLHPQGGSGANPPGVEESAWALEGLAAVLESGWLSAETAAAAREGLIRGARHLGERVLSGGWKAPSPVGFYFAKLWYFEKLYPAIFTVGALARARAGFSAEPAGSRGKAEVRL